jgi:hypothetical protein
MVTSLPKKKVLEKKDGSLHYLKKNMKSQIVDSSRNPM